MPHVDPVTRQPCPVRVVDLAYLWRATHHVVAVVVMRQDQPVH